MQEEGLRHNPLRSKDMLVRPLLNSASAFRSSFPFLISFCYLEQSSGEPGKGLCPEGHVIQKRIIMTVSITFLLHLLAFGVLTTTVISGFILDRKLRKEPDHRVRLTIAGIARTIGLLSPIAAVLLLFTGIGNIHNRFIGPEMRWYTEGWLVAKIVLFVVMVLNGMIYGPRLTRGRLKHLTSIAEQSAPPNADGALRSFNRQITMFYFVQMLLLLLVVYISVFGSGKHPGAL